MAKGLNALQMVEIQSVGSLSDAVIRHAAEEGAPFRIVIRLDCSVEAGLSQSWIPATEFPQIVKIYGSSMRINPLDLCKEIRRLEAVGVDLARFFISERAMLIHPWAKAIARLEQYDRRSRQNGSTAEIQYRSSVTFSALRGEETLWRVLQETASRENRHIRSLRADLMRRISHPQLLVLIREISPEEVLAEYRSVLSVLANRLINVGEYVRAARERGDRILVEGIKELRWERELGVPVPRITIEDLRREGVLV